MGLVLGQVLRDVLVHQGDVVEPYRPRAIPAWFVTTATGMPRD